MVKVESTPVGHLSLVDGVLSASIPLDDTDEDEDEEEEGKSHDETNEPARRHTPVLRLDRRSV